MKFKVLLILCLFLNVLAFAQTEHEVVLVESHLAKDDGHGKAGEPSAIFFTNNIPIYCVVKLDSLKPATVKMNMIAVNVDGVKPETQVITTSYTTNGAQDSVDFTGKPDKVWTAGIYRMDIFIDGEPAKSIEFNIIKAPRQTEKDGFLRERPKQVPIRRLRRNQ